MWWSSKCWNGVHSSFSIVNCNKWFSKCLVLELLQCCPQVSKWKPTRMSSEEALCWFLWIIVKIKVLQQCMSDLCVCGRFRVDGDSKYLTLVQELVRPERNTLTVSFRDVETFNQQLSTTLLEEYYRWAWDLSSSTCSLHWMALLGSWKWKSQMYSMVVYLWSWLSAADPLWSPRPFQQQCKHGSLGASSV